MRDKGFEVTTEYVADLAALKREHMVTSNLTACHTAVIDGYVIEGHVPAEVIYRLLDERPDVVGLSVPGMPIGSPGMEGSPAEHYNVLTFDRQGNTQVYASY